MQDGAGCGQVEGPGEHRGLAEDVLQPRLQMPERGLDRGLQRAVGIRLIGVGQHLQRLVAPGEQLGPGQHLEATRGQHQRQRQPFEGREQRVGIARLDVR